MRFESLRYVAFAALVSQVVGCAENDSTLFVEGVLSPTPPSCEASGDPSAALLFRGKLDVAFRDKYEGLVLVGNQLTPRGNKSELRTETAGFRVRGAEVELRSPQGALIDEFSVNGGGFIQPNSAETPGYGLAEVTMIPASQGQLLRDELEGRRTRTRTLIASIRVFGETLGGVEITSGDFTFPIDVCWGCLVEYPLEAVEAGPEGELVCGVSADNVGFEQCVIGQDERIDCRACASTLEVCYRLE